MGPELRNFQPYPSHCANSNIPTPVQKCTDASKLVSETFQFCGLGGGRPRKLYYSKCAVVFLDNLIVVQVSRNYLYLSCQNFIFVFLTPHNLLRLIMQYSSAPASTESTFQDPPRLRETADNIERYIKRYIRVTYIHKCGKV
jgi:hypothetical protein